MKKQIEKTKTAKTATKQTVTKRKTNKNKATKRKIITKQEKKQQKCFGEKVYFEVVLMIIIIPVSVLFLVPIFQKPLFKEVHRQPQKTVYKTDNKNSVKITTSKTVYSSGNEVILLIKNNSNNSIYFEPCEYLNNFEKKVDGVWINEKKNITEHQVYDSSNFRKEKSLTSCNVGSPRSGAGTYRMVVEVYYGCQMPGGDMCSGSKTFYSNEFKVIGGGNDFCDDKVLENCDGKRVSVTGTFVTSKAHFLSGIENRIVKHQWAGGIMVDTYNLKTERMESGKRYNIVGVIREGGQPCGMDNEQCMLDERGVILPYPTSIKIEKIYPLE